MSGVEPRLVDTGRGLTIIYRDKNLYSPLDPVGGARKRASAVRPSERTLAFVPGIGLGYGLDVLLARLPSSSQVFCVETDQRLMAACSGVPLPRDPRLTVLRTESPTEAATALHTLGLHRFRRLQTVILCGSYALDRAAYDAIREALEEEIGLFWQNRLTLARMSRLWLKNLFVNLRACASAEEAPVETPCRRPILVVGAGPSLESSLKDIEYLRPHLSLLAVDTALPALADSGIIPDWVFVLEAQAVNLEDFLPSRDPSITLLCDLTAFPPAVRLFPKRRWFCTRFHPLSLFDRLEGLGLLPPTLPPLGSVGVAAVQAALTLTAAPILLAGLDFTYLEGKTHARGTPAYRSMHALSSRFLPAGMSSFEALLARPRLRLKDKRGTPVVSDLVLRSYAVQLKRIVGASGRVYDLGGSGLPVGAIPLRSRAEAQELLALAGDAQGTVPPEQANLFRPSAEAFLLFLQGEAALLHRAERELKDRLRGGKSSGALEAVDYVLLSIPEADPARLAARGNLAQALMNVRWYLYLLGRPAASTAPSP